MTGQSRVDQLTALTIPSYTDLFPIYDTSAAVLKYITTLNLFGFINVKHYGATGDGTTDDTAAIQSAITAAVTAGSGVFFPAGKYLVTSTITYATAMWGVPYGKNNQDSATQIIVGISDGSAAFQIPNIDRYFLQGFVFDSTLGSPLTANAIGIESTSNSGRSYMANIYAKHLATAYSLDGILTDFVNLSAYNCTNGFVATTFNANRIYYVGENCTTAMNIQGGGNQLFGSLENNTTGLVLDGARSTKIAMWFESNTVNGKFGESSGCESIDMTGSVAGFGGTPPVNTDTGFILYNVKGFTANSSVLECVLDVRDGSRNVVNNSIGQWVTGHHGFVHREIYQTLTGHCPIENIIQNPYTQNALRWGVNKVTTTNCNYSLETTNSPHYSYNGGGLRLEGTGTASYAHMDFYLTSEQIDYCKGRTAHFGCWLYIPDVSNWDNIGYDISINDGVSSTSLSTSVRQRGGWIYICKELAISNSASQMLMQIWLNNIVGGTAAITDFMVVGVIIIACDVNDTSAMKNGHWIQNRTIGYDEGGRIIYFNDGAVAPTAPGGDIQTYLTGDRVVNYTMLDSSSPRAVVDGNNMVLRERVCSVAGNPGTWTTQYISTVSPAT